MQNLNDPFLQQLVEALPELFKLARIGIVQPSEAFRGKARNLIVDDGAVSCERVANSKIGMPDQTNDVARKCLVQRLALIGEELVRAGEPHLLPRARMRDGHIAL